MNYIKAYLDHAIKENVQIVEFRRELSSNLFYFDEKRNEKSISLLEEYEIMSDFKNEYLKKNPQLIDFSFIIYETRLSLSLIHI